MDRHLQSRLWASSALIWFLISGTLYSLSISVSPHVMSSMMPWAFNWTTGTEQIKDGINFTPHVPAASVGGVLAIVVVPTVLLSLRALLLAPTIESPYLNEPGRLGDVIAAIQAMATYKFYKLSHEDWADRIVADKTQAEKWRRLFEQHPEFFRLDSARENVSLVWRRQFPKRFDVDQMRTLSNADYEALSDSQKLRVSRSALQATDIKTLIDTAVNLHSRALEHQKDKRWWIALASAAGGLVGAIVGALLKS